MFTLLLVVRVIRTFWAHVGSFGSPLSESGYERVLGESGKYSPDTLGLMILEGPRAEATSLGVALLGMPAPTSRATKS
jgi:hypothetical protein